MKLADQLRFVRQNVKKNKSRLFMTVLATAMGCAFLIVLASVGFGLQKSIVEEIVGERLVTEIDVWGVEQKDGQVDNRLSDEHLSYLRSVPHVKAVTSSIRLRQQAEPSIDGKALVSGGVVAMDFAAEAEAGFKLSAGRLPAAAGEVVVGYNIGTSEEVEAETKAEAAADPARWLNRTVELHIQQTAADGSTQMTPIQAVIVGVGEAPTREWLKDRNIYSDYAMLDRIEQVTKTRQGEISPVPAPDGANKAEAQAAAEALGLDQPRLYDSVKIIAKHVDRVSGITEEIRQQGYYNHSIVNELEQVNLVFLIMKIGLIFVGTIAVLIASIGIFNTMTMAVTERAQDIGIMKAVGAHPSVIRRIFLLESAIIGLLGAFIGTAVAYVISYAANFGLPFIVEAALDSKVPQGFKFTYIPMYLAVLSCAISLGVAVLSGSRPAARATKVDVLRALRRDV